jgi:hypothetical protein
MKNPLCYDATIELNLQEVLGAVQREHGIKGIIEGVIDFCCDQSDFTFEDELIKALETFKKENQ